ncbi:MAG TPA: DEAD/DEAH box helicase family protein, partial [Bacteroidota bacterium]|nr:DEAD/DEAH box helicase family protein [Bacteroidota bacterium]
VPACIERSRSGRGGHVWIFFGSPVPASTARAVGSFLLTDTIARRHQVSLGSYDRFFPNQDTLPKGGFGNLIALPLQRQARDQGNSVFLDESLAPFPDQWEYLRSVKRLDREKAVELASTAQRHKVIVAAPEPSAYPGFMLESPNRAPLGPLLKSNPVDHWPSKISVVLSNRLYVPKAGLPSALISTLRTFAAFQNPEFYRRQGMRLSTALTPRVISCFEENDSVIALPRGCLRQVSELLRDLGITVDLDDQREGGSSTAFEFNGKLSPVESEAAEALLKHEMGVFVAPPGLGKTVVGAFLIAARKTSTLVLVHRQELLRLWVIQLSHFLGIEAKEIGRIGSGVNSLNGRLDVAMVPSVIHRGEVRVPLHAYGHIVADECHHVSSISFERVLNSAKPRFLTGLTATPQRRDGHHPIIYMQLGPVRYSVTPRSQAELHRFTHRLIIRETPFKTKQGHESSITIQELYTVLASDEGRNDMIFDDVLSSLEEHRSPILLTERREHLDYFAGRFSKFVRNLIVLHGQMKIRERRDVLARLAAVPPDEERLILATGRYLGEGFDDARLDTLFLALPVAWKGTLIQYSGRLHRARADKKEVRIYDYVDRSVPLLVKMFEKRVRGYRAVGYNPEFGAGVDS